MTLSQTTANAESLFGRILDKAITSSASGSRNNAGFCLACQLRDNGFSQAEAESAAEIYAASVGDRTYTRKEAISSVRSAYKRPPREAWVGRLNSLNSLRPQLARAQSVARFRNEESDRLMDAARDASQRERIARKRGQQLLEAGGGSPKEWEIVFELCLDDQKADRLLEAADWIRTKATEDEIRDYRAEVAR